MLENIPYEIITHHSNGTVGNACAKTQYHTVFDVDEWHKTLWPEFTSRVFSHPDTGEFYHCGYHFVIYQYEGKWQWVQTRAIYEEGAHCIGKNTSSVGVLVVGNYDKCSGEVVRDGAIEQWQKVYDEIQVQMVQYFNRTIDYKKVSPHRKYADKSCHGNTLSDDFFARKIIERGEEVDVELQEQITVIQSLLKLIGEILVKILNRSTSKRLSLREVKKTT